MICSELETFLHDLYAHCPLEAQPVFLTLRAIHPDGDRPTPSRHVMLGDRATLTHALAQLLAANERVWGA